LKFRNGGGFKKTRVCSYQIVKKARRRPFVYTQYWHWTYGRTDRQTDRQASLKPAAVVVLQSADADGKPN